jgi:hypothetical protein
MLTDKYNHLRITCLQCYQTWIKQEEFPQKKKLFHHSLLPLQSRTPKTICVQNTHIPGARFHPVTLNTGTEPTCARKGFLGIQSAPKSKISRTESYNTETNGETTEEKKEKFRNNNQTYR